MVRILIVDDSAFARQVLHEILQSLGHTVLESPGGMDAMEQYFMYQPDLVFLDLIMEEMNGFDVLRNLLQYDDGARVVLATADIQSSTEQEALRLGACAVVNKPLDRAVVLQALKTALQ